MFDADANKEKARNLIQAYLSTMYRQDIFMCFSDFRTLLRLSMDFEKGKIPAISLLCGLFKEEPSKWNPLGYYDNCFEAFVKSEGSEPTQTLDKLVGLKEAKDIVDWLVAQKDWLLWEHEKDGKE